jgi:hypothetical protein
MRQDMHKKIQLVLSDKQRAQFDAIGKKHSLTLRNGTPPSHPSHTPSISPKFNHAKNPHHIDQKSMESVMRADEAIILPVFDMLINGMRKGNTLDKMAAEALIASMRHKRVSAQFIAQCERSISFNQNAYEQESAKLEASIVPLPTRQKTQRLSAPPE